MRQGSLGSWGKQRLLFLGILLVVGALGLTAGCTRNFYRRSADREVNDILAEKNRYPEWQIEQFHVYPDPRARFADPAKNPDRPPMPPDDEAAWKLSPHPQHPPHAGVGNGQNDTYLEILRIWDAENRTEHATGAGASEPKTEVETLGRTGVTIQSMLDGPLSDPDGFLLRLDQAVELGVINSREYQSVREDLYLTALPVTLQRFSFAWQFAAIENAVRQFAGPNSLIGSQNNWTLGSTTSASKLFSTGALLTMSFANTSVFNFLTPGNGFTSTSAINLNLVQPLLQGGGRAVTLEPLTQVERNLVYGIRAYARFREQFYTSIAYGATLPSSLASVVTGATTSAVLAAFNIASTEVANQPRGFLPSLFRNVDMAVDIKYVKDLERALKLFEGFQEGGQVAPLQVDQVRSTLYQAQNTVVRDAQNRANAYDQLKLQLGVPANLRLVLDDSLARPITAVLDGYYKVLADSDAATLALEQQEKVAPEKMRDVLIKGLGALPLVADTKFKNKAPLSLTAWAKLTEKELKAKLENLGEQRRKLLDVKTDLELKGQKFSAADLARLGELDFESDVGSLEILLRRYESRPWEKIKNEEESRADRGKLFRLVAYAAQNVLVYARNERFAHLAEQWPDLPHVPIEDIDLLDADLEQAQEIAVQIALRNRWDVMNARAQVVDAWRQVAVTANALLGVLNVQYHLDSTTPPGGTRPLAFSGSGTNQELIINAQLPLVRVAERNAYRAALINYERARRSLMNVEDNLAAQVRSDVRQLHLFAQNYKIEQKVLASLYSQVENSLELIVAPADPNQLNPSGTAGSANAAALTNQYLSALQGLNGAQTQIYDLWLSYLATRMQLYQDLERLTLDNRGVWTDEPRNCTEISSAAFRGASLGQPAPLPESGVPAGGNERRIAPPLGGAPLGGARLLPPAPAQALD